MVCALQRSYYSLSNNRNDRPLYINQIARFKIADSAGGEEEVNSTIQFDCRVHPDQASYDHFNTALGIQVLVCILTQIKQSSMHASNNYRRRTQ